MNLDDINVSEYFDSSVMPFGMCITHVPTGLSVKGNCKHEQSRLSMQRTLTDTLGILVSHHESETGITGINVSRTKAEQENDQLRTQLMAMQEQIQGLLNASKATPASKVQIEPTKKGWTPERREAAAKRMKERQAVKYPKTEAKVDAPTGDLTEAQLMQQVMRPPTDRPQRLPKAHQSHGSTVVKSNVDWIKE